VTPVYYRFVGISVARQCLFYSEKTTAPSVPRVRPNQILRLVECSPAVLSPRPLPLVVSSCLVIPGSRLPLSSVPSVSFPTLGQLICCSRSSVSPDSVFLSRLGPRTLLYFPSMCCVYSSWTAEPHFRPPFLPYVRSSRQSECVCLLDSCF